MPTEDHAPAPDELAGDLQAPSSEPAIEHLRQILLREQAARIAELEGNVDQLNHKVNDESSLIRMIAPVLGEAIRLKIQEARDEMIEALYPIIGQVVQRAVKEAVSDLARSLDAQAKRAFDLRLAWWRIKARFGGASEAQIRLRELLPFSVSDVLLIHRESGLLLAHLCRDASVSADSDLFSGMLTAIRDFAQDTLGGESEDELGEITYGDQRILIETAQRSYLALIVNGTTPPGYRSEMRERLIEVENEHAEALRDYDGDSKTFDAAQSTLKSLLVTAEPKKISANQMRFLAGALGLLIIFLAGCAMLTSWLWRASHPPVPEPAAIVLPTMTLTRTPTATASPTWTATAQPTPTLTFTFTPQPTAVPSATLAPFIGVMLGNVWVHTGPSTDFPRSGVIFKLGERVELLAVDGNWIFVQLVSDDSAAAAGWIPLSWFGSPMPIPVELITSTALP